MAASPEARGLLYNAESTPRSVDNSYLLNMEIGRSDFGLVILAVEEDDQNYYIKYQYNTVKVQEYSWQPVSTESLLIIAKSSLGRQDLGELVARELGQFIDREYTYAKDAQKIERVKGASAKVVTTKYAGLIGSFLDPTDKVFPGYEPVVKPPSVTTTVAGSLSASQSSQNSDGSTGPTSITTVTIDTGGTVSAIDAVSVDSGVIYPQISADYDDYLKNVAPNGDGSTSSPQGSAQATEVSSIEYLVSSTTTADSGSTTATSTEVVIDNSTSTGVGINATSSEPGT